MFAILESCESKPILPPAVLPLRLFIVSVAVSITSLSGCWSELKERSYDAPKIDNEFVKAPDPKRRRPLPPMMSASSIPLAERRILGAVIPDDQFVYFIKATDRTTRLDSVASEFRSVIENFQIDTQSGAPKLDLPKGWSLKLVKNDGAGMGLAETIAEMNVDAPQGPIKFMVSKFDLPRDLAMWDEYLLSQINRWRGQLQLPPTTVAALRVELPTVPRDRASLPAFIFDANGSDPDAENPSKSLSGAPSEPTKAQSDPLPARPKSKLIYDKPEGWELQPPRPIREATFKITRDAIEGEVSISRAKDSPIQNAAMWIDQVKSAKDTSSVESMAAKTVDEAEPIQAGSRTGKLYSIRASDQPDARSLLVAVIPMGEDEMSLFVKLNCELRMMEEQKSNFLSFVNSLRWE